MSGDGATLVAGVQTDSRLVTAGDLFVALAGVRVDGHDFIARAFAAGAAAGMIREDVFADGPAVHVVDTSASLLALAADERRDFDGRVVAITGANGKTTTKDLTAAVARTRFVTHASPRSFNTEVGVPLTLLGAPVDTEVIIAELGARHVGDVALLCPVVDPDIVVVTNVGVAHMEVFGSWEAIVRAAAEPVSAVREDGVAILNADDPVVVGFTEPHQRTGPSIRAR